MLNCSEKGQFYEDHTYYTNMNSTSRSGPFSNEKTI